MMLIFMLFYVLLCLYGVKFHFDKAETEKSEYLSVSNTLSIKGIFIILVFFSHFNSYISLTGTANSIYLMICSIFGQAMVTLFLFYSGYGIMESIVKKKKSYVNEMPLKRILSTLFKFDCAVLLFLLIGTLLGSRFTWKQVILSFVGWDSLGNSNWYIFTILVLYTITYISFKIAGTQKLWLGVGLVFFLTILFMFCLRYWNLKESYWYDTSLCYVFGMLYSLLKTRVETILRSRLVWFGTLVVLVLLTAVTWRFSSFGLLTNILFYILFTLLVVILSMRVYFKNRALIWCGKNLFELYILQRIPMIVLKAVGLADFNIYIYFACCVICTIAAVIPFQYVTNKIWSFVLIRGGYRN